MSVTPRDAARMVVKAKRTALEDKLCAQLAAHGLHPVREHQFHPVRRWRFDFAFPDHKLAVEVDGGTWSGGRHVRGAGYARDAEKMNAAVAMGWRVLRYTAGMVKKGEAVKEIVEALTNEP